MVVLGWEGSQETEIDRHVSLLGKAIARAWFCIQDMGKFTMTQRAQSIESEELDP